MVLTLIIFLGLIPCGAWAYDEDVHFNLTYVLCRLAGLHLRDALWVADADQSMDENNCTTAFPGFGKVAEQEFNPFTENIWENNGRNWHAFTNEGIILIKPGYPFHQAPTPPATFQYTNPEAGRAAISDRSSELLLRVIASIPPTTNTDPDKMIKADINLGQYLHFEQDYFAHRRLTPDCLDNNKFLYFGPFWGHLVNGHTPDYVGARPELAELMIVDSYKYIRFFVKQCYGKDMAPEVPTNTLKLLIADLAQSYHPTKPVNPSQPYLDVKNAPTQQEANGALIKALVLDMKGTLQSLNIPTGWVMNLPSYSIPDTIEFTEITDADRFKVLPYVLPYDHPEMPLSQVKDRIEHLISSDGLTN